MHLRKLVADAVAFWIDYGLENSQLKYIAKVAARVVGIPPTAAGMLEVMLSYNTFLKGACVAHAEVLACQLKPHNINAGGNATGLHSGVCGATTGTAFWQADCPSSSTATTISACWTEHTTAGHLWTGILS